MLSSQMHSNRPVPVPSTVIEVNYNVLHLNEPDLGNFIEDNRSNNFVAVNPTGKWSTELFDCLKDGESCWWGAWCCCLVSGRTAESFQISNSFSQSCYFILFVFIILLLFAYDPMESIILLIIGVFLFSCYRASIRTSIRKNYNIANGNFISDVMIHTFCSCCAVCQEAREVKARGLESRDLCYAELLSVIDVNEEQALDFVDNGGCGNFLKLLSSTSQTSKLIVFLSLILACLVLISLFITHRPQSAAMLLLVFIQPILILYWVYWRSRSRYASLDYVIKTFACGFFIATLQSVCLESFLEFLLEVVVSLFIAILGIGGGGSQRRILGGSDDYSSQFGSKEFVQEYFAVVLLVLFILAFVIAAGVHHLITFYMSVYPLLVCIIITLLYI